MGSKRHHNKNNKKNRRSVADETLYQGSFISSAKGFGFVHIDDIDEDIFIAKNKTLNAFHGDKVEVRIYSRTKGDKREGVVVKILSHEITSVVGTYERSGSFGFVICDDKKIGKDIFIPAGKDLGAVDGHKVVADITSYGTKQNSPEGVIREIIGHKNDPGVDIMSMVIAFGVPYEFPTKVLNQAAKASKPVSIDDMLGRRDFRGELMVTIDGADAKDLDDAVSVTYDGANYKLGVYIADVSNYVQYGSALDKEAYKRGTSIYLVDRVIPMLPHALSNGICSLNQGEDRLALCCIMTINKQGEIIDHDICEGVVNVDHRMTYDDVSAILDGDDDLIRRYEDVADMFRLMKELSDILRGKRRSRGGIDFDIKETKFVLDDDGNIVDIKPYIRNEASMIIEDFMLAANETVAEDFFHRESAFLYRSHSKPDTDKVRSLREIASRLGYILRGSNDNMHPKEFQKMLSSVKGSEKEALLTKLTLRTMQQAKYSYDNTSHFGLAAEYYCHFTSPIRRYPDLYIHRIIKDHIRGRYDSKKANYYTKILPMVASSTSKTERRAEELEREVEKVKKVKYMHQFLGEEYSAIVSSTTPYGMYVELDNGVDGLVHISTLRGDRYNYIESRLELVGERTGKTYSIGDRVDVILTAASEDTRTIDFELSKGD